MTDALGRREGNTNRPDINYSAVRKKAIKRQKDRDKKSSGSSSSRGSSRSNSSNITVTATGRDSSGNPIYWTSGGTRHEGQPPAGATRSSSSSPDGVRKSDTIISSQSKTTSRSAAQRAAENIQASNRKEFEQQLRAQYGSRVGEITRSSGEKEYYVDGRLSAEYNPEGHRVLTTGTYTNPRTGNKQSVQSDRSSLQQAGVSRTREYEEAVAERNEKVRERNKEIKEFSENRVSQEHQVKVIRDKRGYITGYEDPIAKQSVSAGEGKYFTEQSIRKMEEARANAPMSIYELGRLVENKKKPVGLQKEELKGMEKVERELKKLRSKGKKQGGFIGNSKGAIAGAGVSILTTAEVIGDFTRKQSYPAQLLLSKTFDKYPTPKNPFSPEISTFGSLLTGTKPQLSLYPIGRTLKQEPGFSTGFIAGEIAQGFAPELASSSGKLFRYGSDAITARRVSKKYKGQLVSADFQRDLARFNIDDVKIVGRPLDQVRVSAQQLSATKNVLRKERYISPEWGSKQEIPVSKLGNPEDLFEASGRIDFRTGRLSLKDDIGVRSRVFDSGDTATMEAVFKKNLELYTPELSVTRKVQGLDVRKNIPTTPQRDISIINFRDGDLSLGRYTASEGIVRFRRMKDPVFSKDRTVDNIKELQFSPLRITDNRRALIADDLEDVSVTILSEGSKVTRGARGGVARLSDDPPFRIEKLQPTCFKKF